MATIRSANVWTLDGVLIGTFGTTQWELGIRKTYEHQVSSAKMDTHMWSKEMKVLIPTKSKTIEILSTHNTHQVLTDESLPKPGEVWVRVSSYSTSRKDSYSPRRSMTMEDMMEVSNKLRNPIDINDIVTVIRINKSEVRLNLFFVMRGRNPNPPLQLIAWDGNST